jgi:WD40 repeat protein
MRRHFECLVKFLYLMALALSTVGCASHIHEKFIFNFIEDSKTNDGSFNKRVVGMSYNDKGRFLIVGEESGNLDIWDARQANAKRRIKVHDHRVNWIAFASSGDQFFTNSYFERETKLWSAKTGELVHVIPNTRGPVITTSDARMHLVSDESVIHVFDIERKELLSRTDGSSGVILTMAFDDASQQVAVGTASGTLEIWKYSNINNEPKLRKVQSSAPYVVGNWVMGIAFTPGGRTVFSVARSGLIDEWDSQSLEKVRSLSTSMMHVHSAAFDIPRARLALGGTSNTIGGDPGYVEVISLDSGKVISPSRVGNLPVVEFGPEDILFASQINSVRTYLVRAK